MNGEGCSFPVPGSRNRGRPAGVRGGAPLAWPSVEEDDPPTEELRLTQGQRERDERRDAERATEEEETLTHERRADKAEYLKRKLQERAESERDG